MAITREQALREYPELSCLALIKEAGWDFELMTDEAGELSCVVGYRREKQYLDAVYVYDMTDTVAVRMVLDQAGSRGGIVWQRGGHLADTLNELLELPPPDLWLSPLIAAPAPRLGCLS
ncbi:hypothetical protein [Actinoalloteichus spitiensis]|uniref:hypothetical protein n=1 Tax=Actinoalloteichus spitiensis TaxID=252394 RepID=UPI0012F678B1|nr:hypothetical protein [Actinoalloteichus spitiensis]